MDGQTGYRADLERWTDMHIARNTIEHVYKTSTIEVHLYKHENLSMDTHIYVDR